MITLRAQLIDPEYRRQDPPTWSGITPLRWHVALAAGLLVGMIVGASL